MALQGKLHHPKRFITTHNDKGEAVIDTSLPEDAPFYPIPGGAGFAQAYVTKGFPTQLNDGADMAVYKQYLDSAPGLTVSDGTVLRYVDIPPASLSPMHRTVSLDYGVVLDGEVELILDSGETRVLQKGDVCIQRATMHAWRNLSDTEWARMLYILQPAQPLQVVGKEFKEDLADMQGVRSST
ncbi:uncharacterized protein E0L32_003999 [Thyridium curvatum]|uniref:Cupin type-2 domain-containing protein n=1 Tax=Thyridium curvatum TaxID=1093900 RepID=A0A507BID4_9PEZI|nr:uncharacterized protein E0L32_003999 [Thyridium curvatum]TPX16350.1 hypothetical protein E0L32_003999 [Thyridium curvatum]